MKKFLGLIVLLVALAVCAAALVACDLDSGNQATPQSIQFEDKDGADRSTFWDLGAFPYGTAYEDILPTFKVNLCYSDGSTKELRLHRLVRKNRRGRRPAPVHSRRSRRGFLSDNLRQGHFPGENAFYGQYGGTHRPDTLAVA